MWRIKLRAWCARRIWLLAGILTGVLASLLEYMTGFHTGQALLQIAVVLAGFILD